MCVSAVISDYLGLVPYGTHGIEMQHQGRKIAVFNNHKSVKHNWREAVMFAIGWHQTLFYDAASAHVFATEHGAVVYTWQCFGKQNWLRRGATNVDTCTARKCRRAFCYTVLPTDAPESVRLPDDDGDNMPQDDSEYKEALNGRCYLCAMWRTVGCFWNYVREGRRRYVA